MMIVIVVVTSLPAGFVVMHGTGPHSRKDVVDKVLYYCSPIEPNYGFDSFEYVICHNSDNYNHVCCFKLFFILSKIYGSME